MTRHITFILFTMTVLLNSCNDSEKLDKSQVEYIEIRKHADTVSLRLANHQVDNFVEVLNDAKSKGGTKYLAEYTIIVHTKSDSIIAYRTSGDLIKESDDLTYSIGETKYFRNLWLTQIGLSDNWFEYFPVYKKDDQLTETRGKCDKKHWTLSKKF